jgi:phospholipid N-methyltransferase
MNKCTSRRVPRKHEQVLLFAKNFLKYPKMLGSLVPSSRFLIESLLSPVDWERAQVFVEYGPGVGTFTREILNRMRPDGTLIALETNEEFVHFLRAELPDPRLRVFHESATQVTRVLSELGLAEADYVVSGIPFSTLPKPVREQILQATYDALHPSGTLLVYQFSNSVLPHLKKFFPNVSQDFEPLNILPARLFYCAR